MGARIHVKERITGMHKWKNPDSRVDFLGNDHVHDFIYTVSCKVFHNDRDIEFYILRNSIKKYLNKYMKQDGIAMFGGRSCEMLAEEMLRWLYNEYGSRGWMVTVSENPQQGASVDEAQIITTNEDDPMDITLKKYDQLVNKARSIFKQRRSSYGNSVNEIDLHTIVGLMRMKLFRIYNEGLTSNTTDELLDTINYAVFALSRVGKDD